MKYLEQYIEEKMKIKVLGELTTNGSVDGDEVGVSLVIDGYEPGIEVWYMDYANWLEEKIEDLEFKLKSESKQTEISTTKIGKNYDIVISKIKRKDIKEFKLEDFYNEVLSAIENKPKIWRDGQFVFNYIESEYGVARDVEFVFDIDCYYNDDNIKEFILKSYELIKERFDEIQNNLSEEEVTKVEIENLKINKNRHKMKLEDFRTEVLSALESKPEKWRDGQFVFNYIDATYGVARHLQFVKGIDCFYDDGLIDEFIVRSYEEIKNRLK